MVRHHLAYQVGDHFDPNALFEVIEYILVKIEKAHEICSIGFWCTGKSA